MTQHLDKLTFTISASSTTSIIFTIMDNDFKRYTITENLEVTTTPTTHTIEWDASSITASSHMDFISNIEFSINDQNIPVTLTNVILHSV